MTTFELNSPVEDLVRLGLNRSQAKVYSSLAFLGAASVSDVSKDSGVPRTKAYEVLSELANMGAVEYQAGRPVLYKAVHPSLLVRQLREEYMDSAVRVSRLLQYERQQGSKLDSHDLAWTVKGLGAVRRKLSDIVSGSRESVLIVEAYPPLIIGLVKATLKAALNRGVKVRAVSLVGEGTQVERGMELVEFRKLKRSKTPQDYRVTQMLEFVRGMESGAFGAAIVDRRESLVFLPDRRHLEESVGISLKMPGVPLLQKMLIEDLVSSQTVLA